MSNGYDAAIVRKADESAAGAVKDFLAHAGEETAVVVSAPAGAGKSELVCKAVGRARRERLRIAVATPTNEQAFGLVRRLALAQSGQTVTFLPASTVSLPASVAALPNVQELEAKQANGASLVVGTIAKLGDAFSRGTLTPLDALVVDESFQADSSRYYALAGLAPTHLLVGDGGQLSPFSVVSDADRWRGLPEDPLQTAVGVLLRNHPATPVHPLPITRRLDARAVPIARAFYPSLSFDAAVVAGARELRLSRAAGGDRRTRVLDRALERAAHSGWAHLELPAAPVLSADPETIDVLVALVRRLFSREPRTRCERITEPAELLPKRVAVGVSHNDQKDLLRATFEQEGLGDVVVDTANKLQGLEFDVVLAWHPLAGLTEADEFHLDPGRLCVLLTRHRHACIVVGRAEDRRLVDGVPPPSRAYLGWDPDPVLDGWAAHESVFSLLEPHVIHF